jgi:hypothetical protein
MDTDQATAAVKGDLLIFARLADKFTGNDVKRRSQGGRELLYITSRSVMNRLDDVVGPSNWWDDYIPIDNAVICRLSIRLPDGQVLTKCDVGGNSKTPDSSDVEKSGFSDAFKRAAVKFGIGRHLYADGVPNFVRAILGATNGSNGNGAH